MMFQGFAKNIRGVEKVHLFELNESVFGLCKFVCKYIYIDIYTDMYIYVYVKRFFFLELNESMFGL